MVPDTERPHVADLRFDYGSDDAAELVAAAVRQEVDEIEGDRTAATVAQAGRSVRVDIAADDLVALRAGLNTWATLVGVAERMVEAGRGDGG